MLANVQRLQMQAAGAYFDQQRIEQHLGEANAFVLRQTLAQQLQIFNEFGRAGVGCKNLLRAQRETLMEVLQEAPAPGRIVRRWPVAIWAAAWRPLPERSATTSA